jgi:hypothetical protein
MILRRDISYDYLPIILILPQPQHHSNKTEKQDQQKGIGICKEIQSVYLVLCVNTEPCANVRREVRADLEDGIFVA